MMHNQFNKPIGIFDSGIGGLTVAHAIQQKLPNEQLVYFGDTAHLPYGDKSEAAIQAYSIKIADVLLAYQCKVIVIACNSASSAAYELLKAYVGSKAHVIDVINPMVQVVSRTMSSKKIGLIGTKRTVQSGVYAGKLAALPIPVVVNQVATPLLVHMIEEGFFDNKISHDIIDQYLSNDSLQNIDALILACTHFPLIKKEIEAYYKHKVAILDSAEEVATSLANYLTEQNLHRVEKQLPNHTFLVSDYTASFEASTKLFFGEVVKLTKHPLWE
jgi:glutamate racemase